jgi:hypothetical protein
VGVAQRVVEQSQQLAVIAPQRQQRLERVADLAGEDRRLQPFAGHVTEHGQGLRVVLVRGMDAVEVTADAVGVDTGPVTAGELHALHFPQGRRQQVPHQCVGDRVLLGVQTRGGHRRSGPGGEQAGEGLLRLAEHRPRRPAQQNQRAGRNAVAGKRDDRRRADLAEVLGDHPVGSGGGVDPA